MFLPSKLKLLLPLEKPLVIYPELARKIGLNESIVIQQLHYWLQENESKETHIKEGRVWSYNTTEEWRKNFPFWSEKTIRRIFDNLVEMDLVIKKNLNTNKQIQTKWCTIKYEKLISVFKGNSDGQNDQLGLSDCPTADGQNDQLYNITEINTETTTERVEKATPFSDFENRNIQSPKLENSQVEEFKKTFALPEPDDYFGHLTKPKGVAENKNAASVQNTKPQAPSPATPASNQKAEVKELRELMDSYIKKIGLTPDEELAFRIKRAIQSKQDAIGFLTYLQKIKIHKDDFEEKKYKAKAIDWWYEDFLEWNADNKGYLEEMKNYKQPTDEEYQEIALKNVREMLENMKMMERMRNSKPKNNT